MLNLSPEKKIAGLALIAVVITMMLAGAIGNILLAEAGIQPVYFPRIQTRVEVAQMPVIIQARLSHYWPPLGGTNCARFIDGYCVSRTASGERWEDWVGIGAACPPEMPFWTQFRLPGGELFTCVDRGGMIVAEGGIPWLDLLVESPPVEYGTVVDVELIETR